MTVARCSTSVAFLVTVALCGFAAAEDGWTTFQGNMRRTGCVDEVPGPTRGDVLWVYPGRSHHLAAPTPAGGRLFVTALGAFNAPEFAALDLADRPQKRVVWTKSSPTFRLPTVGSPVVADGIVYVGEGMHENVAGVLSAFSARDGLPLWRYEVEGKLRHLEGAPLVREGHRIYFGCGSEGVICLDASRVRTGGRELSIEDYEKHARVVRAELLAAHEIEKRSDEFAVPPSDGAVLASLDPQLKTVWTAGRDRWHVDSSVAYLELQGDDEGSAVVLAGSAFLDEEQVGFRGVVCIDARSGVQQWTLPLPLNPWGSPSVARLRVGAGSARRPVALVGCSSIRFDPSTVPGARGQVVAIDVRSGERIWKIDVPGGVLCPVAVDPATERGVFTATDGVVRCVDVTRGEVLWSQRGRSPYFAGVALSGGRVYSVDLDGRVDAFGIDRGKRLWSLGVGRDPRVGLPGRVFGSLVCAGGRIYVATHNVEGPQQSRPTAIVAIGEADRESGRDVGVRVDRVRRRVLVDVEIAPRKLPHLEKIYPIEVMATAREGKKAHETVLLSAAKPSDVHRAIESLGLRAGSPGIGETSRPSGPEVRLLLEFPGRVGLTKRVDLACTVVDRRTGLGVTSGAAARRVRWIFTGSSVIEAAEPGSDLVYGADFSGTLATIYPVTAETVLQSTLDMEAESLLTLEVSPRLPAVGTRATLVIEPVGTASTAGEGK